MKREYFFLIVLCTLLTSAFVWVRLQIVSISYDIHKLQAAEQGLREEAQRLTDKINEARSPHRLESMARLQFGMKQPRPDQIIVIKEQQR